MGASFQGGGVNSIFNDWLSSDHDAAFSSCNVGFQGGPNPFTQLRFIKERIRWGGASKSR